MAFTVTFHGGAESVTGSHFLIEGEKSKVLVDCGVVQGLGYDEQEMLAPFPYDASSIDALVITHAHLDHVGRAPKLIKEGFRGKVYMTPPTRDLTELILRDSARIIGQEANRHGHEPLFTEVEVNAFLARYVALPYGEEWEVAEGFSVLLRNTGHILGSASVRIRDAEGASFGITSDIGASPAPLLPDAEPITDAKVILIESVYGDRQNTEKEQRVDQLQKTLARAIARGGTILIPAFSIERTQLMLYEIGNLFAEGKLPQIPVFLDSPLAISVTHVYEKWASEYFKTSAREELKMEGNLFSFPFLTMTEDREGSESIQKTSNPKIIIAGAGMSHGGRIGRHEAHYLPGKENTLIMVGYQAPGTPGRVLQAGGKRVRIDGREVKVRAQVETMYGWSGHTDRDGLVSFAGRCVPDATAFLVGLGEPASARFLAQRITHFVGVKAIVPTKGQSFTITKDGISH